MLSISRKKEKKKKNRNSTVFTVGLSIFNRQNADILENDVIIDRNPETQHLSLDEIDLNGSDLRLRLRVCTGIKPLFSVHHDRSGVTKWVRLKPSHHLSVFFFSFASSAADGRSSLGRNQPRLDVSPTLTSTEERVQVSQRFKKQTNKKTPQKIRIQPF